MTTKRLPAPAASPARPFPKRAASLRFRRLKWNELVRSGDFVAVLERGFERWEGPTGFRADAFVKPIYRRDKVRNNVAKRNRPVPA
jgi:hypothetical protein